MKEVVWVTGRSAAGKRYFIDFVTSGDSEDLLRRLGWENKTVVSSPESINYTIGDMGEQRKQILKTVPKLINSADVVLIKWQFTDSRDTLPQQLKQKLPLAKHEVILLEVGFSENAERLPNKSWWNKPGREFEYTKSEYSLVAQCLNELSKDFPITTIDSSSSGKYKVLNKTR